MIHRDIGASGHRGIGYRGIGMLMVLIVTLSARRAAAPVPVLVELFTSEGCSSCPPADKLLIELLRDQPVPGVQIVGLSEHVDYWDRQGWRDPFSDPKFTRRQNEYAFAKKSTDVYTPQMIVDGGAVFVGSDRATALAEIGRAARTPQTSLSLTVSSTNASVSLSAHPELADAHVWLAIAESGLRSNVTRGENEGRTIEHASVTRRLIDLGRVSKLGQFQKDVPLALDPAWHVSALQVIAFAQADTDKRVSAISVMPIPR